MNTSLELLKEKLGQSRKIGLRSFEELNPEIFELVRQERPYKIPKGYLPWQTISAIVGASIISWNDKHFSKADLASKFHCHRTILWFLQNAPIYCLSNSLLRAFEKTEVTTKERLFRGLEIPLPTFMVLFPQNALMTPTGKPLDYAVVHVSDVEHPERSTASGYGFKLDYLQHEHKINLHWTSIDPQQTVWFAGCGIEEDGHILFDDTRDLGSDPLSVEDKAFTNRVRSIVLQCLLAISCMPELLESEISAEPKHNSQRRHQLAKQADKVLTPRWLGRGYKVKTEHLPAKGGSHASPVEHWRAGHYREQPCGKNRKDRKIIWIQPTRVGVSK